LTFKSTPQFYSLEALSVMASSDLTIRLTGQQ
jgi:hypothetical protein